VYGIPKLPSHRGKERSRNGDVKGTQFQGRCSQPPDACNLHNVAKKIAREYPPRMRFGVDNRREGSKGEQESFNPPGRLRSVRNKTVREDLELASPVPLRDEPAEANMRRRGVAKSLAPGRRPRKVLWSPSIRAYSTKTR